MAANGVVEEKQVDSGGSAGPGWSDWPSKARMILSALDAGSHPQTNRRRLDRIPFHTRATLSFFSDADGTQPRTLYTRDLHCRSMGFITPSRLPLGHGGTLVLKLSDGQLFCISCTLLRCRETAGGWYEGAVYFNREQVDLAESAV